MEGSSCCQRQAPAPAPAPGYCPHLQENLYLKSIVHQGFMWYSNGYARTPSPTYGKSFAGSTGGYWKASPPPVVGQGPGNSGAGYWKTSPPPPAGQACSPSDPYPQKNLLHQPKFGMCRQEATDCSQNPLKQTTPTSPFHRWPLEQPSGMQIQQTSSYPQHFQQERSFQPLQQQQPPPRPSFPRLPSLLSMERMPHPAQPQPPRPPDVQEQMQQTAFSSQRRQQQQQQQQGPPRPRQQHLQYGHPEKIPPLEALQRPAALEGQRELLPCQLQRIYHQQQQGSAAPPPQQMPSAHHHQQSQHPLHLPLVVQQQLDQLKQRIQRPQQQQIQPLQQLQQLQPTHQIQQQAPPSQQIQPLLQQKPSHHHHHHQQQQLPPLQSPQQQQKSSCLLQEYLQLPGNTQQPFLQPQGTGDQQRPSREVSFGAQRTHQEEAPEGVPDQECHRTQSRDGERCRESCQYSARLQSDRRGQLLHAADADVRNGFQSQQSGPNPSQALQQRGGLDHRRSSLVQQPESVATATEHSQEGHTENSRQKTTEEPQTSTYEPHPRITEESHHRMANESHPRAVQCREKGQETGHSRSKGHQSPAEVKLRRERLGLKYRLGKFARLLGPDSPVERCASPEVKQPRFTNSCMYSTNAPSASVNINPCDTSVNCFISGEVTSPRNPGEAFAPSNDAKDCVAPSSKSSDTGSPSPNELFYNSCFVPSISQGCSTMECPPVTRVGEPESVIVNAVRPNAVASDGEKNVTSPLTISLTPPPTPPVPTSSPKSSRSVVNDPVPSKVFDKVLPVCDALPGDSEDIKPVTFTKSFLEPMPALPDHTPDIPKHTPGLLEDTPVIKVCTLMASEQSDHTPPVPETPALPSSSEHITIQPEDLPMDSGLQPAIPRVSPNLPDLPVRDDPEVIIITDDSPTIPQISPDLPEATSTAEATRQKTMELQSAISTATQPTVPTAGAVEPQAAPLSQPTVVASGAPSRSCSSEGRPADGRGSQGPSTYKFFRNLCIQARFSMYVPPDLEFPCLMCNASVAGEEALYHLFFGQIQCAVCGVLVSNCRDFRTLETLNTTCLKDHRGEHNLLMWSLDPIDFVSYHMRRSLVVKASADGKDSSPTTAEVVDEMANFLEKFSILKQHSPWAQAIRKCWKYVRNMKSTPDLTLRVKMKRKQLVPDSPRDPVGSSPNSKTRRVEDSAKVGPASQGPPEEGVKETEERSDEEHNTKRRKPGDEDCVSPVAEDEETCPGGASEKWLTPEGLRQHLERKAPLCEASQCGQESCALGGHGHTPSSVSLTAKELAIARSARFPDSSSLGLLESPEVESEYGDFLLSLPYNHDMLDQIIQYVSVADDRIRRPDSTREDSPTNGLQDSPEATALEGEDLASPESPGLSPGHSPRVGESQRSSPGLEDNRLESTKTTGEERGPRKRIYKPMPKSRRRRFSPTGSELSLDGGDLPQLTPPDLRSPDARSTEKDFVIYKYPSGPCPEECPLCYEILCASEFVLNTVSFVASTACRSCGLFIYILQDSVSVGSRRDASLRPGPKSRTKQSSASAQTP